MPAVDLVHLKDEGLEWLLRPVSKGWCKMESLKDGTLDLSDVALMNDMIDIENENAFRINQAMRHDG